MSMDSPEFSIYPRGFLGARAGEGVDRLIQRPDPIFKQVQHTFKFPEVQNVKAYSNKSVDKYWKAYLNRIGDTGTFQFRENVLLVALEAFGTMEFALWYSKQFVSPSVGDMHHRFLDDTLRFIQEGRREMCMENWSALLRQPDTPDTKELISDYAAQFFGISSTGMNYAPRSNDLIDILQRWTAQPNGFEDLLSTLHILFGALD